MDNEMVFRVILNHDEQLQIIWGLKSMIKDYEKTIALNVSDFCNEYAQKRIKICRQAIEKVENAPYRSK